MRERLIIRWPYHPEQSASWVLTDAQGRLQGDICSGGLEQCVEVGAGRQVVVLVPAADVLLTKVTVPTRNRHRLQQAVPFALEDQLSEDVGTLHFALGPDLPDGSISVAVVARERMQTWLDGLQAAGVRPDMLVPETLALPTAEREWSLLVEGNSAILRSAVAQGGYAEVSHIPLMLEAAYRESGDESPQRLRLDVVVDSEVLEPSIGLEIDRREVGAALEVFAAALDETPSIDLLQGAYSRREQLSRMWRPWRAAAVLAAVWVVLQGVLAGYDLWRFKSEVAAQDQQINQLFRTALPEVQRIVDPRAQMEQKLRALRGGGQSGGALALMAGVGEILQGEATTRLNAASYRGGRLDLDLELKDIQALDRIKQQATQRLKAEAEIVSAATQGDKVTGRLRLGGGS